MRGPITAVAALIIGTACGPAQRSQANGFWLPGDGGAGVVVYEHDGGQLWLGSKIYLARISLSLDLNCSDFANSSSGLVTSSTSEETVTVLKNRLVPNGAQFDLQFDLPPSVDVDRKYRLRASNPPPTSGPVTAKFAGTMNLESSEAATVNFRVEYRDSLSLLSTDEASLTVTRAQICQ